LSYGKFEENYYIPVEYVHNKKPSITVENGVITILIPKAEDWN